MLSDLLFRLRSLVRAKTVDAELDDELHFHFERQVQKYVSAGLPRHEAERRARVEFGGLDQVKEDCRDARGVNLLETLWMDLRYGLRTLRKSPGFTAVALATLALGIGANTAIFSVVYGVLLRPLPYHDASRLLILNETTPKVGLVSVSYPNFLDWRAQSRAFSDMAAVSSVGFNLAGISQPESIEGLAVSPNFLTMLGVHPALGRDFDASEEKTGAAPVVLLSYPLWQSHFGGDAGALGRTIRLDGRSYTIVGVLPADFRWIEKSDVLEPIGVWAAGNRTVNERGDRGDMVVAARLGRGVALARARAEMEGIAARLARAYPATNDQFGVSVRPVRDVLVGNIRPAVLVLWGAVIFVLFVACANVANLFLMRGAGRAREMALRMAIGASGGRIVRQMLTESFLVAFLGGAAGVALAMGSIRGIARLIPADLLAGSTIGVNAAVLLFSAGVAMLSMFVFGLAPALHSRKTDVQSELKEAARTTSGGAAQTRWRGALATAEIALALILLVGAGLMVKSLHRLLSVDPGFRADRVLRMEMDLRTAQYDKNPAVLNFWDRVLSDVRALPGVESAALGDGVPLTGDHSRTDITIEGMALPKPGSFPHPDVHIVSPGYVATLGIRLLGGRAFNAGDRENAPRVAMINARLAREYFHDVNPVGKRFLFGRPTPDSAPKWLTIVGVVADTKMYGLANPSRLEVYVPYRQYAARNMNLLVKSATDPAALTSAIRRAVASIDKDQPVVGIVTMRQLMDDDVSTRRITLVLLGLFSGLALALAAIGIYGVISYSAAQRVREVGIRVALGAQPGEVLRLILAQGAKIAGAGIAIGVLIAAGLTRLMTKLLYSVSAADPATFAAVAVGLALIAMLACYIPARRALKVDPVVALRHE